MENGNDELKSRTELCVLFVESNVASFWLFISEISAVLIFFFSNRRQYLSYFDIVSNNFLMFHIVDVDFVRILFLAIMIHVYFFFKRDR